MSTPSYTAQSLSTVSRRTMAIIAAAVGAVALAVVLLALNSGTTQPTTLKLFNATPVKSITPAGAGTAQNRGTLELRPQPLGALEVDVVQQTAEKRPGAMNGSLVCARR